MTRSTSLLYFFVIVMVCSCDTAGNVDPVFQDYFTKYYGVDGNQEAVDILVNPDGSMILLGNSSSQNDPTPTPFVVKIDPTGSVLWQRQIGMLGESAADVDVDHNGNLIIVSNIGDEPNSRIHLFKIGQNGVSVDSLVVEMGEKQVARSVMQASDNSFLIAGYAAPNPSRNVQLQIPPADEADYIVVKVAEGPGGKFDTNPEIMLDMGGGEHVGSLAKIFETITSGPTRYLIFGDSDRPDKGTYKRSFEAAGINQFGYANGIRTVSGISNEIQISSTAIKTYGPLSDGYLQVGTTYGTGNIDIYITQYDNTLTIKRLDLALRFNSRLVEGISAAISEGDGFFILANEIQPNGKRDIIVLKMSSDGIVLGSTSFGTLEGDDMAGAISVLPGGRIALLGTIELETQKKMSLMILSPDGKFSN